jgi:hypothetical protein
MLRYLTESLLANGGFPGAVKIVVWVSPDAPYRDLAAEQAWARRLDLEWRWVNPELFREHGYAATGTLVRLAGPFEADLVLLLDADVLVSGSLAAVIEDAWEHQRLLGTIAHLSPFSFGLEPPLPNEPSWRRLFDAAGLPPPQLCCQHSMWPLYAGLPRLVGDPEYRYCPPYFNFGFILAPRAQMQTLGATIERDVAAANQVFSTLFRGQLALTLALSRHRVAWRALGLEYNFPCTKPPAVFDEGTFERLDEVRVWHYIDDAEISKYRDFEGPETVGRILQRSDLNPLLAAFQRQLARVHERIIGEGA